MEIFFSIHLKAVPVEIPDFNSKCEWWNRHSVHHKCGTTRRLNTCLRRNPNQRHEHGCVWWVQVATMSPAYVHAVSPSHALVTFAWQTTNVPLGYSSAREAVAQFREFLGCFGLFQHWTWVLHSSKPRPAKSQVWGFARVLPLIARHVDNNISWPKRRGQGFFFQMRLPHR